MCGLPPPSVTRELSRAVETWQLHLTNCVFTLHLMMKSNPVCAPVHTSCL